MDDIVSKRTRKRQEAAQRKLLNLLKKEDLESLSTFDMDDCRDKNRNELIDNIIEFWNDMLKHETEHAKFHREEINHEIRNRIGELFDIATRGF